MIDSFVRRLFDRRKQVVAVAQERRHTQRMTPARATEHLFKSIDNLSCAAERLQKKK